MSKNSDYSRLLNKINLSTSIERTYTSYFRNSIILFSLGLTVIGLTKKGENQKLLLAFSLLLGGILLGFVSIKEYYQKINLIKDHKYDQISQNVSNTVYIVVGILIIFRSLVYDMGFSTSENPTNFFSQYAVFKTSIIIIIPVIMNIV